MYTTRMKPTSIKRTYLFCHVLVVTINNPPPTAKHRHTAPWNRDRKTEWLFTLCSSNSESTIAHSFLHMDVAYSANIWLCMGRFQPFSTWAEPSRAERQSVTGKGKESSNCGKYPSIAQKVEVQCVCVCVLSCSTVPNVQAFLLMCSVKSR